METRTEYLKIFFWIFLFLSMVGFVDSLSKPFITPIVGTHFGKEIEEDSISFLMAACMDMTPSSTGLLWNMCLESAIVLNSGFWAVLLIFAFFIHKLYKQESSKKDHSVFDQNVTTQETSSISEYRWITLVGGIFATILSLLFLLSFFEGLANNGLILFPLAGGISFFLGGFILLKDYFSRNGFSFILLSKNEWEFLKKKHVFLSLGIIFTSLLVSFGFIYDIGLNSSYFIKRDFATAFIARQTGDCETFQSYHLQEAGEWLARCINERNREDVYPIKSFKLKNINIRGNEAFLQVEIERDNYRVTTQLAIKGHQLPEGGYLVNYQMKRLNGRWFFNQFPNSK